MPREFPLVKTLVDPVWEYDHEVGKSITGGYVYRGKKLPGLVGSYLYADYVSGRLWALRYDAASKKVVSNHALQSDRKQVISYGEDETGESLLPGRRPQGSGYLPLRSNEVGQVTCRYRRPWLHQITRSAV